MKVPEFFRHAAFILVALCITVIWPVVTHFEVFGTSGSVDAVTSASVALPEEPSGSFIVLVNTKLHSDSLEAWKSFFSDDSDDYAVIFDDFSCIIADGDIAGAQMAERYQVILPENQMRLRTENSTLLASKAENGMIDVVIVSKEMAEAMELGHCDGIAWIEVENGGNSDAQA